MLDGSFFAGTGLGIYLGAHTGSGSYIVVATNPTTGCTSNMADTAKVVIRPSNIPSVTIGDGSGFDTVCSGS